MTFLLDNQTLLMGIVNITPNSFSDGAKYLAPAEAIAQGKKLMREGAAILDLGAEATSFFRKGVEPVPADEQLCRLLPAVKGLRDVSGVVLSIDTRSADVARACIGAGAHVINDVSAGEHDRGMLKTAAELGVPIVLMHISPSYPDNPPFDDPDILRTVRGYLEDRAGAALAAGVRRDNIWLDPGVGFGKTMRDNMILALGFPQLPGLEWPVVLGVSRKRFLQTATAGQYRGMTHLRTAAKRLSGAEEAHGPDAHDCDAGTAAVVAYHAALRPRRHGLVHRVHNVALCARALAEAGNTAPGSTG